MIHPVYCSFCAEEQEAFITLSGPHIKASCSKCFTYIKFISLQDVPRAEAYSDATLKLVEGDVTKIHEIIGNRVLPLPTNFKLKLYRYCSIYHLVKRHFDANS